MTHFGLSLIYLLFVIALVTGYVCFFHIIYCYIIQIFIGLKKWQWNRYTFQPKSHCFSISKRRLVTYVIACSVIAFGLYTYERKHWITSDSAHLDAKQYLVVGRVLIDFRSIGYRFIYPERLIWRPASLLQDLITTTGLNLIPESDGERGIWKYQFVLVPYINRLHLPHTKEVYRLIETSEEILETLLTKEIEDKDFDQKYKYITYPLVTLYYFYSYKSQYFLEPGPKRYYEGFYKDPIQYEKLKLVVDWALQMEEEWARYPEVLDFMEQNPMIELSHIASVALLLQEILEYQIQHLLFTCDDKYLKLNWEAVTRYSADDSPYHEVGPDQGGRFKAPVIYHGTRINFFGHRLCQLPKLPYYEIRHVNYLKGEGPGWYHAFIELNKRLLPPEQQQENLERTDNRQNINNQ